MWFVVTVEPMTFARVDTSALQWDVNITGVTTDVLTIPSGITNTFVLFTVTVCAVPAALINVAITVVIAVDDDCIVWAATYGQSGECDCECGVFELFHCITSN